MLILWASLLGVALQPHIADWRQFDHRRMGFGETPVLYDAATVKKRGSIVLVTIRYTMFFSGRNPATYYPRTEIDCVHRRTRVVGGEEDPGWFRAPRVKIRREWRSKPIAAGSIEAALADTIC